MKNGIVQMDTAAADHQACGYCEYIWETYNPDFILLPCFDIATVKHSGRWYCDFHYDIALAEEAADNG
jgi:hypothetical protein